MAELYDTAFSTVNWPYSMALTLIVLYWLLVVIGLLNVETFDFDVDADVDVGGDADFDGGELETGTAGGFSMLGFLNMGEVPIMFYATIVVLCMWVNSVKLNEWFNPEGNGWFALALAIPNFFASVFVAKLVLQPVRIYRRKRQHKTSLVGKVCVVTSLELNNKFGRCEVPTDSSPILVNARTAKNEVLLKGDPAVIVKHLPEEGFFIVTRQNWE